VLGLDELRFREGAWTVNSCSIYSCASLPPHVCLSAGTRGLLWIKRTSRGFEFEWGSGRDPRFAPDGWECPHAFFDGVSELLPRSLQGRTHSDDFTEIEKLALRVPA